MSDDANVPRFLRCRQLRRQDVVDRERELESLAGVRKRVVLRERLANSSLRKVSEPVCCGEVDVKIAYDRISSRTVGAFCALLRPRASDR